MTPTKAIHIGIVICALLWVGFVAMPESMHLAIPGLWLVTLPLAGWVLAVTARRSAMRRAILWIWVLVLVLLPGASISYRLAVLWDIPPLAALAYSGPLESLAPLAIAVAMLWPAILIVLLFLFKWTTSGQEAEASRLSQV
jgi:hypothetical protein